MKKDESKKFREEIKEHFKRGVYNVPLIGQHLNATDKMVHWHINQTPQLSRMWQAHKDKQAQQRASKRAKIIQSVKVRGITETALKYGYNYHTVKAVVYNERQGKQIVREAKKVEAKSGYYVPKFYF